MKSHLLLSLALTLNVGLPAPQAAEKPFPAAEKPAIESLSLATLSATVTAVDHATREVTLRDAEGNETTLRIGKEVKNLPQVEIGDRVDIAYYESVEVEVLDPKEAEPRTAAISTLETAEPGGKPAGQLTTGVSVVASIDAIDKTAQTVTLKGLDGNTSAVRVREPANLGPVNTYQIAVEVKEQASEE